MHGQLGTLLLEDILCFKYSLLLKILVNKNPDVSIATKGLPLYSKNKRTSNKAFKSKENNIKSNNKKENNIKALKKNNIIYVQGKRKEKKKVCLPLENLQSMS